jgi:probable F420-dependent oxidoreductase
MITGWSDREDTTVKVGVEVFFTGEPGSQLSDCGPLAQAVEEMGFHSLWTPDHVVTFAKYGANYPYGSGESGVGPHGWLDPLWVLAAAGAATRTLRLGTGIVIVPQRNPVILAKEIVALDHMTGGRLDFGVGVGWSPEEYAALGVPWEGRGRRMDEYLQAMNVLWTDDVSTFEGDFVSFRDAVALPKPRQAPHPPVLIGGQTRPALRRAARLGDGWLSWLLPPEELSATNAQLDQECQVAGRDPGEVRRVNVTPYAGRDEFAKYLDAAAEAGADEVVAVPMVPAAALRDTISEIADVMATAA